MPHPGDPGVVAMPGVCPTPGLLGASRFRGLPDPGAQRPWSMPRVARPPPRPPRRRRLGLGRMRGLVQTVELCISRSAMSLSRARSAARRCCMSQFSLRLPHIRRLASRCWASSVVGSMIGNMALMTGTFGMVAVPRATLPNFVVALTTSLRRVPRSPGWRTATTPRSVSMGMDREVDLVLIRSEHILCDSDHEAFQEAGRVLHTRRCGRPGQKNGTFGDALFLVPRSIEGCFREPRHQIAARASSPMEPASGSVWNEFDDVVCISLLLPMWLFLNI